MLYTRGRFAEMNGVTLFTLRHYEKLGLLHPASEGENGYRLYSERESRRLSMITLLTRLGFSLKEIKDLADHDEGIDFEEFEKVLLTMQQKARQEVRRYQAIESFIDNLVHYTMDFDKQPAGVPFVVGPTAPRGFVSDPLDFCDPGCEAAAQAFLLQTERAMGHSAEYPLSYLIDAAERGSAQPLCRVFVRTNQVVDDPHFRAWVAENTLVMVHEGPRLTSFDALRSLYSHALAEGYEVTGPAMLTEMQRHFFSTEEADRRVLVGLPVRKDG